jgi:hypothetical protein
MEAIPWLLWLAVIVPFVIAAFACLIVVRRSAKRKDLIPYFGLGFIFHMALSEIAKFV